jgi:hypothetical protein
MKLEEGGGKEESFDVGGLGHRYKREEAKIQAWENHEKAKAEAEMRRIEVFLFCYQPNSHFCCRTTPLKNKIPCYDAFTLDVKSMLKMKI